MKILLFGMTGLGNEVLKSVMLSGAEVIGVVTQPAFLEFPYYKEEDLIALAERSGVRLILDELELKESFLNKADIILVASYPKKIPVVQFSKARYAFNIHPSLLPNYRGPNPYFWVIKNGEVLTGITIHFLTDKFDAGPVVLRCRYPIKDNETQGTLRYELAKLSRLCVTELLESVKKNTLCAIEDEPKTYKNLVYARKIQEYDRILDPRESTIDAERTIRALTPYPGQIQ